MFDIGWSELLVIAVVAIVVVGPKDLPKLMRSIGHYAGKLRRTASDFQRQFEEAMRETEIEEVKKAIESVRNEPPPIDPGAPIDKPVMLPKPKDASAETNAEPGPAPKPNDASAETSPEAVSAPKPQARKRAAKPKTPRAKRSKKPSEPAP
jgi:sec-independent protein translocase protein TatB